MVVPILTAVAFVAGQVLVAAPAATAAVSGWYVATVPGTGVDDVPLATTCANALECWTVGVSLSNLSGNGPSTVNPLVESWNGTTWSLITPALPAGQGGGFFGITCVNGADCWAVGAMVAPGAANPTGTLTEHWDGAAWTPVASPTPTGSGVTGAILNSVDCTSATNCLAVGYTTDVNGNNLFDVIEQWNGSVWSIVPGADTGQAFDQLKGIDCLGATDCWAVGNAGPAQQMSDFLPIFPGAADNAGLVEHWNGVGWSIVPSVGEPPPNGIYLSAITCVVATDCWTTGSVTDSSGASSGIVVEHWDGSTWTDASTSVAGSSAPGILSSVSCVSANQCWAAGSTGSFNNGSSGPQVQSLVEFWNGSSWSVEPTPQVSALSFLDSIGCVPSVGCITGGSTLTSPGGNDPGFRPFIEQLTFPPASNQGLLLSARDGGVFAYGTAAFVGSMGGRHLNAPIVGVAPTPNGRGYWLVGADGGVFAFGDATFLGSMGSRRLNAPIVGMAATVDGQGYWLVASDGGVFAFGDADFRGSMGGVHLNASVVAMTGTSQEGYDLVASDGGVFSFGAARFLGSAGGLRLAAPVTGMTATPDGRGYWLVAGDGGVFSYGSAGFFGSVLGQGISGQPPVVGITATPSGAGYWLAGTTGAVYAYGDADFLGAPYGSRLVAPVVGLAAP